MNSTSNQSLSLVALEIPESTDKGTATDRVEELVGSVRNLPTGAEKPEVSHALRYEPVARLLVHGPRDIRELRPLERRIERELLDRGIAKVSITGLPEDELAIQIPQATLEDLGLSLMRSATSDSLESAQVMQDWPAEAAGRFPPEVFLTVYDESWTPIRDRIGPLLKNGSGGLLLVIGILFPCLNGRVAFWVTVGIAVSFMATLAVVYVAGGSLNMISLFARIMALGIVVGEDALTHYQTAEGSLEAAEGGARRMPAPAMSSLLTTVAAFIPRFAVSGLIGSIPATSLS